MSIATRYELLSFMNTGTKEKPVWSLIGEGFSDLTENLNPKTKDSHYIHQKSGSSSVVAYAPTFDFTAELDKDDPVAVYIAGIGRDRKVGAECETEIVNCYTWMQGTTAGSYVAYKQKVAIKVDNSGSGAGGEAMALTGSLMYKGDPVKGEFSEDTLTFNEISSKEKPSNEDTNPSENE